MIRHKRTKRTRPRDEINYVLCCEADRGLMETAVNAAISNAQATARERNDAAGARGYEWNADWMFVGGPRVVLFNDGSEQWFQAIEIRLHSWGRRISRTVAISKAKRNRAAKKKASAQTAKRRAAVTDGEIERANVQGEADADAAGTRATKRRGGA